MVRILIFDSNSKRAVSQTLPHITHMKSSRSTKLKPYDCHARPRSSATARNVAPKEVRMFHLNNKCFKRVIIVSDQLKKSEIFPPDDFNRSLSLQICNSADFRLVSGLF